MKTGENRTFVVKAAIPAAVCICAGLLACGCAKDKGQAPVVQDTTAARTNAVTAAVANPDELVVAVYGKKLTTGMVTEEVDRFLATRQSQGASPGPVPDATRSKVKSSVVERFVAQCLLEHEVEAQNIMVDDKECEKEIKKFGAKLPDGFTIEMMLAMQGIDAAKFKEQIARDLKIGKLLEQVTTNVPAPTAEEVNSFYTNSLNAFDMPENVHVRHILVAFENTAGPDKGDAKSVDQAAKDEKRKKAEALREQIVKGADFAEVAKADSDDPGSKGGGGDLGRLTKGHTVLEFEKAAFSQEVNVLGPVVETEYGYHIIQVLDRRDAGVLPLKEVEKDVSSYLLGERRKEVVSEYLNKLRAKAGAAIEEAK